MYKKGRCLILILASFQLLSCKKKPESCDKIISARKKYQSFIQKADSLLLDDDFCGAVLVAKKDKIIFASGYGSSDPENETAPQNNINTIFEAGSITKQMTAAAILQLEKKHKISQNDKISSFFPDLFPTEDIRNQITIKMLLNMRSGLTDHINAGEEFFPREVFLEIEKNQKKCRPVSENLVMTYLPSSPLLTNPGNTYFYCNTNYYLLAKIIEKNYGKSYADCMKKEILKKAGMTKSNFDFQNTSSRGYTGCRYYSIPAGLSLGCGDLNSSAVDLFRWNRAFVKGKIIPKKYIKQLKKAKGYNYGFYCGNKMIFHAGNTNVFNSYSSYNFKKGISIIVLTNRPVNVSNATVIAGKLSKLFSQL